MVFMALVAAVVPVPSKLFTVLVTFPVTAFAKFAVCPIRDWEVSCAELNMFEAVLAVACVIVPATLVTASETEFINDAEVFKTLVVMGTAAFVIVLTPFTAHFPNSPMKEPNDLEDLPFEEESSRFYDAYIMVRVVFLAVSRREFARDSIC